MNDWMFLRAMFGNLHKRRSNVFVFFKAVVDFELKDTLIRLLYSFLHG